jgi:hypothetical protein
MEHVSREPLPDEQVMDYAMLGGAHAQRGRQLFATGMGLLGVVLVVLAYRANVEDMMHLMLGLIMFALSVVPSLLWARGGGSRFPVFETIMILCANAYALPVLNAQEQLADYSPGVITQASLSVILYQLTAILTYQNVTGIPGRSTFWREALITNQVEKYMVYGLILSTIYIAVSNFTTWIPRDLESLLRAIFFGISILCTFISAQRWGRGEMRQDEKAVMVVTVTLQLTMMSVGLVLIQAISQLGIGILGYLCGGKRVPWLVLLIAFPIIALLHTGKTRMREKYWQGGAPLPTLTQLPTFYSEWIDNGLLPTSGSKSVSQKMLERTSLMHILCLITTYTPDRQDYLYGSTYRHVIPQLIPRFFWPEKPRSHVATYELGIYYGLQREEDNATTTIAFGLLAEAYANFGMVGAIMLGAFWGYWLKKLQIWSTFSPMLSFAGLLMVLLTAWAFNAEMTMAVWVSSLQQAATVVLGVPLLVRSLLGGN